MVVHVPVDLHAEEVRSQEQAGLAVPGGQAGHGRIGGERAPRVLVHADRDGQVVLSGLDRPGGHADRGPGGRAPVENPAQRNAGQPELADDRVGIGHLEAADEPGLHLRPADPRVGERRAHRVGGHVHGRLATEPPEGMQSHADDNRFHHASPLVCAGELTGSGGEFSESAPVSGANANVSTSVPSGVTV